jgi:hypothetical protein
MPSRRTWTVSSIHKQHRIALGVSVGVVAAALVAGCQGKSRERTPFSDVTDRDRAQSTYAMASQGGQQPTTVAAASPTAAQTPPPEVGEAARMQSPRLPVTAPPAEAETARVERDVRQSEPRDVNAVAVIDAGDAVADRTGRPTTQGTNVIYIDQWGGARRQWAISASERASGDVLAGPYYGPQQLSDRLGRQEWHRGWLEPVDFFVNVVLMPVRAVRTPPNAKVVYSEIDEASMSPAATDAPTPAEGLPPGARSPIDERGGSFGDQIPEFRRSGSSRSGSGGGAR